MFRLIVLIILTVGSGCMDMDMDREKDSEVEEKSDTTGFVGNEFVSSTPTIFVSRDYNPYNDPDNIFFDRISQNIVYYLEVNDIEATRLLIQTVEVMNAYKWLRAVKEYTPKKSVRLANSWHKKGVEHK